MKIHQTDNIKMWFLLWGFFSHSFTVTAQVPGYTGKRFSVQYNNSMYLRYKSAYKPDSIKNANEFGVNNRHNLNAEFVLSKDFSIGAGIKKFRTGYDGIRQWKNNNAHDYKYLNLQSSGYSFLLKKFSFKNKGSIAPIGTYNQFEFCLIVTSGQVQDKSGDAFIDIIDFGVVPAKTFVFIYSFGQQHLFFEKILVDYGFEFAFIPQSIPVEINKKLEINYTLTQSDFRNNQLYYNIAVQDRLFSQMMFNVHIGFGVLLF